MTMDKTYASAAEDVADIPSGAALAEGGLGLSGNSIPLIDAVLASGPADLSVASNNGSVDGWGLGVLLNAGRTSKISASYGERTRSLLVSTRRVSWRWN